MKDFLTTEGAEGAEEERREWPRDLVGSNVRAIAYTGISGDPPFKAERGLKSSLQTNYDYLTGLDIISQLTANY
ncbi:MAG TPA: hypothetical protein DD001_02460 [Microcoleaceae bacterium UBA10368]|jgi:hypothetical protein|nr:hypothetical protein [Microcoleaceae cyanobacterium UBA10368]HCV30518.1 hypothetical protein [Microcoleaceae cyanobacterium UBA9251]